MPLIKARSSSIINSVDLRGAPTAATANVGTSTTQIASTAFVSRSVSDLINSSPAVLDTLSELAAAINNDDNFATTVANSIGTKVTRAGDTLTGFLTLHADPSSSMHAATKNYVDDQINAQMIYSTDDVAEGTLNKYYSTSAVRTDIGLASDNQSVLSYSSATGQFTYVHPNSDGILEGSTNQYFSQSRARNSVSINSDDNAILSYSNVTGQFTFTTPDTDKIVEGSINQYFSTVRARNSISNGSNINYDAATGIISTQAAVWSVNGQTGAVTLTTDDVTQGSTNLYFTNALAQGAISLTTNDNTILSYASGVFTFNKPDTDKVAEGANNQYHTTGRARASISVAGWSNVSYDPNSGVITVTAPTTDDVPEGSNNQYHSTVRVRNALSATDAGGDGSFAYDSTSGVFTYTGPSATEARAHFSAIKVSGDGSFSYDNATGTFSYTGPTNTEYRGAVSANDAGGDGSFAYDSASGVFTYTGPSATEARGHFSANDAGGDGSFAYDSATGVFTYTGPSAAEARAHFSATTASGVTYDPATGVVALATIPNASLANSDVTVNGATIALGGSATLDADDIAEAIGGTNKYFTEARFDTSLSTKTTDDVAEGTRLYYTQTRFNSAFAAKSTTDLAEGTNEYFTQTRARNSLVAGTGVTYTAGTGTIAIGQPVGTTDDVTFNDLTVSGDLTVQGTLTSIQSNIVEIADKNLTLAKGAANAAAANGAGLTIDGANANFFYSSGDDRWNVDRHVNVTGGVTVTTTMTATQGFVGDLTGNVTGDVDAANVSVSSLTNGRVTFAGAGGDLVDSSQLTFDTATGELTAFQLDTSILTASMASITTLTTTRVPFIGTNGAIIDDARLTYDGTVGGGVLTSTGGFAGNLTGNVTGNVTGNLTGNVTGQVSSIANHTTDTLTEGTTNLYATATRVRQALSATDAGGDGSFAYDQATGVFTYTGPSASEARAHFSAIDASGDGSFSYDNATGAFTYTGPSATEARAHFSAIDLGGDGSFSYDSASGAFTYTGPSATEARAHFNATTASGVTYDSATGVIALAAIPNSSLTNDSVTINGQSVALGASTTLDTDDIAEGSNNEYFTQTRARNAISLTTSDASVLTYDAATGAFTFSLAGIDTDEVQELPNAINQYFTTARARASVNNGSNINYDPATGTISTLAAVHSVNGQTGVAVLDTDDVSDVGATNKYFTQAAARSSIALTTDNPAILDYAPGTGEFTFVTPTTDAIDEGAVNEYYTAAKADARIAAASVLDLSDVTLDANNALSDGYSLVYNAALQAFVAQNVTVTVTTMNFTGDGTTTSFNTELEVNTINDVQVFINGLIQAPTYSFTISTVDGETSVVFDAAPELNDFIMVRLTPTAQLSAGGILNENSSIDGGTY